MREKLIVTGTGEIRFRSPCLRFAQGHVPTEGGVGCLIWPSPHIRQKTFPSQAFPLCLRASNDPGFDPGEWVVRIFLHLRLRDYGTRLFAKEGYPCWEEALARQFQDRANRLFPWITYHTI